MTRVLISRHKKLLFSVILTLILVLGEVLAEGVLRIVQPSLAEAYAALFEELAVGA